MGELGCGFDAKNITFGEWHDVVVLVAEAAVAAPEAVADDVACGILPPPLRVPPRQHRRLPPARRPGILVEGPRAVLLFRSRAPAAAVVPARSGRALHRAGPPASISPWEARGRIDLPIWTFFPFSEKNIRALFFYIIDFIDQRQDTTMG